MKLVVGGVALIGCIYLAGAPILHMVRGESFAALSVFSGLNPNTVEAVILKHYKAMVPAFEPDLQEKNYTLTTSFVHLNDDKLKDLVVVLVSDATCGSGGCLASIFLQNEYRTFEAIDFSYTVKDVEVLDTYTMGMRDLRINHDATHHLIWDGSTYVLEAEVENTFAR